MTVQKYRSRATIEAIRFDDNDETVAEIIEWVSKTKGAEAEYRPPVKGTGSVASPGAGAKLIVRQAAPVGSTGPRAGVVCDVGDSLARRQGRFEKIAGSTFSAQYEVVGVDQIVVKVSEPQAPVDTTVGGPMAPDDVDLTPYAGMTHDEVVAAQSPEEPS